jgi:hypothetical protein
VLLQHLARSRHATIGAERPSIAADAIGATGKDKTAATSSGGAKAFEQVRLGEAYGRREL